MDHKEEEELTEEERKAAWAEYEAEKKVVHAFSFFLSVYYLKEQWGRKGPHFKQVLYNEFAEAYCPVMSVWITATFGGKVGNKKKIFYV